MMISSAMRVWLLLIVTVLFAACGSDLKPISSPEADLVFITNRGQGFDIYKIRIDGTGETRLTQNPGWDWNPGWSSALSGILHNTTDTAGTFSIALMDPSGKFKTFDAGELGEYILSPDGTRVLYTEKLNDSTNHINMKLLERGETVNLTPKGYYNNRPAWSPDGKKIAFISDRDGDPDLFMLDVESRSISKLYGDSNPQKYHSWAPDSRRIVFSTEFYDAKKNDLYILDTESGERKALTNNDFTDSEIAWSPNGAWIAFHSTRDGQDQIWVIRPDGTGEKQVTTAEAYHGEPAWVPVN